MMFSSFVGVDYSGAQYPNSRLREIQAYRAKGGLEPVLVRTPNAPEGQNWHWNRTELAEWLISLLREKDTVIVGIDHAFSFPVSYLQRYRLDSWTNFLTDFCDHWNTRSKSVDECRGGTERVGDNDEFRLTERWTSSAKSVFHFDVSGQVAKSTHAGIPWLALIRQKLADSIHIWPFDGWEVPTGVSVVAEVYPSLFRNRYRQEENEPGRTDHQQDAYSVARWLMEMDQRHALPRYFDPPLTKNERKIANLEGWILGVT